MKKLFILFLILLSTFMFISCDGEEELVINEKDIPLCGGWYDVENTTIEDIDRFNRATGLEVDSVKLIQSQVVAGVNYRYEYIKNGETKEVIIFEDLNGNLEVLEK